MKKTIYVTFTLFMITGLVLAQTVLKQEQKPLLKLKPRITVQYPNGGETWKMGQSYLIRWSSVGVKGPVTVSIAGKKGGKTYSIWKALVNDVTTGQVKFKVPATLKGIYKARVRVSQLRGPLSDISNADFTILGKIILTPIPLKSIKIILPLEKTGGVTYYRNGKYAVIWKTTGKIKSIGIKLVWTYKEEPPLVYILHASTPNDGREDIIITPNIPAIKYYKLVVFDTDYPQIKDSRTVNIEVQ